MRIITKEFLKNATLLRVDVSLDILAILRDSPKTSSFIYERVFAMWKVSKRLPLLIEPNDWLDLLSCLFLWSNESPNSALSTC